MASYSDGLEHESNPKRIKLDARASDGGGSCRGGEFSTFFKCSDGRSDPSEAVSTDCDSGYEASTIESFSTPTHQSGENENSMPTPSHPDTSQDSIDPEVDEDSNSTVSELSGLSDLSSQEWNPMNGSFTWIQKKMNSGMDPRTVLIDLGIEMNQIPDYVDDITLWKLIINMLAEPPRRRKLKHVNTLHDVVRLMKGARKIIVLTGAGVSVSCGIPDFRSRDGIYSRLAIDFPDLPDPQTMFDISYFTQDPRPFFKFARDIYPGKFKPSPCHRFIRLLERYGKLLRNYTQNIDTLEKEAEIEKVIECHGSFATATCTKCGYKVTASTIRESVLAQNIPVCDKCRPDIGPAIPISAFTDQEPEELKELVSSGVMKPDIVFFGEGLPDSFHDAMSSDKNECDLLVVIGSSLKVRPVALIPSSLPSHVPQILINREPLPHCHFDVELLGDCDVIINHLCHMLGETWKENASDPEMLQEATQLLPWKDVEDSSRREIFSDYCDHENSSHAELIKERRHMSVDSARDSGIGENSNFADVDVETPQVESKKTYEEDHNSFLSNSEIEIPCSVLEANKIDSEPGCSNFSNKIDKSEDECMDNNDSINDYWQPSEKRCITERLPENTFYYMQPSRYIFPGAELFCDPTDRSENYHNIKYDMERLNKFTTKL